MISSSAILAKFGSRVRELRKAECLSQEGLAAKANLHRTYIGTIKRAEKNVTLLNIYKLARALEIEPYKLLK